MFTGFYVFYFFSEKLGSKYTAKVNATVMVTYRISMVEQTDEKKFKEYFDLS